MSVRISVESLSGCAWNGCPSQRGIRTLKVFLATPARYLVEHLDQNREANGRVQVGHTKLESTVRYLGIEVDDALEMAEQTEV